MRFLKWVLGGLLFIVALVAVLIVTVGWTLSAPVSDETSAKMAKSKQFQAGKFVNEEPEAGIEITFGWLTEQFKAYNRQSPEEQIPVVPIEPVNLKKPPEPGLRMAWLGHAGVLIEIDGKRILTDPILSQRASPFSFAGPKRFHLPPISITDISGIDAIIISHNHYDHLDKVTIQKLTDQGTQVFVPLGNRPQLLDWNISESLVTEMDWWQEVDLGDVKITATPARHYSSRGLFDYQETLWTSWAIVGNKHRVFFSGDTGYSKAFSKIGEKLGPFDLTVIKVGAYGPGQMWHDIHMPPEEAIQTHKDLNGKTMLPVHWGTFDLGNHEWDEPIIRTVAAANKAGIKLVTPRLGEMVDPTNHKNIFWWEVIN